MDVLEAAMLEELVSCVGEVVPHTRHRADQVSAGAQVSDLSEEFLRVALLGQGVLSCVTFANDADVVAAVGLADGKLKGLAFGRALNEGPLDLE
jgi:hypothetical protein